MPQPITIGGITSPDLMGVTFPTSLTELELTDLDLTQIPDGIQNLQNLKELGLRSNEISQIPDWLLQMPGHVEGEHVVQLEATRYRKPRSSESST